MTFNLSHILKILLILIVPVLMFNSCSNNKKEKEPEPEVTFTTREEPKTVTETKPVEAAPDAVEIKRNDTARTKDFIFVVKNISEPEIDRSGYSVTKPEDSEKYIAVQIWVKNISNVEVSISREDFKLLDQEDAEFVEKTAFTEHRKKPILFESGYQSDITLKPNQAKSGWVTFTTAITSKPAKIQYDFITVKL